MPSTGSVVNRKALSQSLIAMGLLIPGLLLFPLGIGPAMSLFTYGVLLGLLVALPMGLRRAMLMVGSFTVFNLIAYAASPHPLLAALVMAGAVFVYGLTLRVGLATSIVVAPISVAFTITQPPTVLPHSSVAANMLVLAVVCIVAGMWGTATGTVMKRRVQLPPLTQIPWRSTWVYTGSLTVVCGVIALIVSLTKFQQDGAWVLLTILVVAQPGVHRTWRKAGHRVLGTFIGFGVALVVGLPLNGHPLILTLAAILLFGIAAYVMLSGRPYWQFVTFLTPGVVLVVGASSNIFTTDISRVWSTIVGIALALGVLILLGAIGIRDRDEKAQSLGH
jgi:hypothetical protein